MPARKNNVHNFKKPAAHRLRRADFRRLLDESPVYVSTFLPDGTLTYVNKLLAQSTGRSPSDLIGKRFFDMLPPEESMSLQKRLNSLSPEQSTDTRTQIYITPEGRKLCQQWTNRAFFNADGLPVRYVAFGQDITEQKQINDKIQHLSSFPELSPNPIMEVTLDGEVIFANLSALKVLENIGKDRSCLPELLPCDLQDILGEWGVNDEMICHREIRLADRIFDETIHLIPGIAVARIYANDITTEKEIGMQLKMSEETYRCFANLTSDSLLKCSRTGTEPFRIEWIAGSVGLISGYSAEEIMGFGCILHFVHEDDRKNVSSELLRMVPGEVKIIEFRIVTKEGDTRWIAEKCRCEKGAGKGELVLYGSVRDITDRKKMEETLRLTYIELKRHDTRMIILNEMNDLLLSVDCREEAYAIICDAAEKLFPPYSGKLAICHEDSSECTVVEYWGDEINNCSTFPLSDCWALKHKTSHKVCNPSESKCCKHYSGRRESPHFCLPIIAHNHVLGLLHIIAPDNEPPPYEFDEIFNLGMTMKESITLALSNLLLRETLRKEAIHDPLTGLFNRRYLEETLSIELKNHQRNKEPLTVAMLDLDHFKLFNDEYGHEAGDIVLKEIGALLHRSLRGGDIACRYGGEELTVILTGSTMEHALPRVDNIRQMIMDLNLRCRGRVLPKVTVSIGMSEARPNEAEAATILRRADTALYQAKQQGRNRIVTG